MSHFEPTNIGDRQKGSYRPATGSTGVPTAIATRVAVTTDGIPIDVTLASASTINVDFDVTLRNSGNVTLLTGLSDTTWVEAPLTPMTGRKFVMVQNQSGNNNIVMWAYANQAASGAVGQGIKLEDGGFKERVVGSGITIFLKMFSGSGTAAVEEGS